ncbi:MAG: hypothetical protein KDB95_13090, partial [Flavobacteriales bacterium]|nr:hypothetical protein [Flavobacteriales bacterium]
NGRRVGVGTNAPSQDLDVEGTFQLKDGTQGDKKILTSDAEGNASWELVTPGGLFGTGGLPLPPVDPEPCPRLSGTIGVGVDPRQVKTANDRVFVVSEGSDELFVVNVMDPDAPVMEGTLFMGPGSDPNALAHSGNHLYVLCEGSDELKVVDIADPSVPVLKGTLGIGTFPVSIVVENDLAYVVDFGSNDLKVIDVSDPDLPALLGSTVVGPSPGSVAVSGGYAFISKLGAGQLVVVDISDPSMPALTSGVLSLGPGPISSAISGSYLYVVDYSSQDLKVIDVSSPLSPALSTSVPLGMSPNTVVVSGSYAYVTDQGSDDIKVFDISVPTAPALGIGFPLGTDPVSCAISGSFAYVVDQGADELVIVQLECVLNIDTDSTTYSPIYDPYTGELTLVEGWQVSDDTLYTLGKAVGIGTSFPFGLDPEAELAIVDTTGDAGLALGAHGVAASLTAHADTVSAGLRIGTLSGHPMMFGTAGTAWMKLDTSGQLGIRTMSPMLPLDVRGNGQVGNLDGTEDGYFMIRSDGAPSSTTTSGLRLTSSSGGGCATWGELVLSQDPQGGSASSASRLSFSLRDDQCSPPIERMVIAHNGHVGIGTTTPSAMLDVDGTIRFRNGSEAPGKLLVSDADGNATWSSVTGSGLFPSYFQPASIPADFSCLSQSAILDVGTQASAIEVFDDHAYVLTPLQDLKVFNISDPGSPTLVTQRSVPGVTWWVHASGDLLLVTTTSAGFTLFDISDRDAPVSLGQFNNGGHYRSIGVSGDHAVCLVEVSGATDRLELVNVSDPTNPVLASSLTIGGTPWAMALTNDLACYVDQGTDQMKVVDISDPSTPVMKGSAPIGIVSTAIAAHDDLVYVVSNGNGLEIFDISDPNSPVLLGSADLWSDPNSIELVDHYAVIVDAVSDELSVVDVQNPMAPVVVNTMGVGSQPESVGIQGNHAYVVDYVNFDLRSIQLTCPTLATYNAFADEFGSTPIGDLDITENETDPVYSAWDKSSGISITESQVSDLQHFTTADETDPQVGSITTGYVPRWSGTELVTGSVFDNGNVGIGTSAPTRRFQVHDSNGGTIRPAVKIKVNNCGSPCTQPETTQ